MNSNELKDLIGQRKLRYENKYSELIKNISVKGDSSGKGNFSTFGAYYQTFMYAFIIGYKIKKCTILKTSDSSDFAPIADWKPNAIRDYIIMIALNDTKDINSILIYLENAENEKISEFVTDCVKKIEGYANAGLEYLKNIWDNNSIEFQDPFVFVNILRGLTEPDS